MNARTWLQDIREHADPHLTCVLIGMCTAFIPVSIPPCCWLTGNPANKVDLCANDDVEGSGTRKRQVTTAEADLWAKEEGLLFLEASAKTGDNVDEVSQCCPFS